MVNKEGTMKPRALIVATGLAVTVVALAAPAYAQSARIAVGAIFTAGPQYPQRAPSPPPRVAERRGPDGYGGYGWRGSREVALNRGFDDGYAQGIDASRHRNRYDPSREGWYRRAERGYDRDSRMSRDEYRDIYRRGFVQGYESGYRDGLRGRGGWNGRDGSYDRQPQSGWSRNR
jgi:opacity protein-like surface antigen